MRKTAYDGAMHGHSHAHGLRPGHGHGHGHAHGHAGGGARHRRPLALALALTLGVLVVQVVTGLLTGSLALLSDAGHMATDALGLGMAVAALHAASRTAPLRRTF